MKIFVLVKQVPDTETKIKISSDGHGIDTSNVKWVVNPFDEFAIEESVKLKEQTAGSQVYAITAGPKKRVGEVLRTALAMGADEGILIDAPENLDAFSTAKALSAAIKAEGGADLIFCGKLASDDNGSSVGQMVATLLGLPHATVVSKFSKTGDLCVVERDIEGGAKEQLELRGPAVVAANKGLNLPRYASLPGIMKAKKKVLKELDWAALGVTAADQKVTFTNLTLPRDKPPVKIITGDLATQTMELVKLLRDEAKAL